VPLFATCNISESLVNQLSGYSALVWLDVVLG